MNKAEDNKKERRVSDATVYRLALYHCLVTDWLLGGRKEPVTSRDIADALDLNDVTVRNDLSYLTEAPGKRGVGYDPVDLRKSLTNTLGLENYLPIGFVGEASFINGLLKVINAEHFGFMPVAFFSENPDDVGISINGREVYGLERIPELVPALGVEVVVMACQPAWVQKTIDLLGEAGVKGVMNLTPTVSPKVPEGVRFHQRRLPCDLKALFFRVTSCCTLDDKGMNQDLMGAISTKSS